MLSDHHKKIVVIFTKRKHLYEQLYIGSTHTKVRVGETREGNLTSHFNTYHLITSPYNGGEGERADWTRAIPFVRDSSTRGLNINT